MGRAIANAQANLQTVLSTVLAAQPTAQFAVADYKDTADAGGFFVRQSLTASTAPFRSPSMETTNPSGKNVPRAGNTNPDGFYELLAVDVVDVSPDIVISDSADPSVEFGSFPSGTRIKLTQAPGATRRQKPGPGAIDWHITLKGDALLVATDFSGNKSDPISCLVPPPPK
jgi:hypothetical protein